MMEIGSFKQYQSHGDGKFSISDFKQLGINVIFESGVLVFHPENITIGDNVYFGHYTILKGYYKNHISIGENTWIGQDCFFHGAGGLKIGRAVGIGPKVSILTSVHNNDKPKAAVMENELQFAEVIIGDGVDIGVGSIILPGITIGEGAIVGAGSVVTKNVEPFSVVAGIPAKFLRMR
jgi:acetyltransferase-like isoleucine patch superfamily enzyme